MVARDKEKRTAGEWAFLLLFYPVVIGFYLIYRYPRWLLPEGADLRTFYLFGKSPGFWYNSLYTAIIVGTCVWVLLTGLNRYQWRSKKNPLSRYQRAKFTSILLAQAIGFYILPFIVPGLLQTGGFWNDPAKLPTKTAHVYIYPGFQSWGMAVYLFLVIPLAVWFFGKRYCSWFCACGNLAETIGVLPWGAKWVRLHTPRGETTKRLEVIQVWVLAFAVFFGVMLLLDGLKLFSAPSQLTALQGFQDFFIDFLFGSVPAAMAVSLLVGTVRTLAHYTQSPAEILTAMNQRMLGRSKHGFTTCLVLRLDPDGSATVANAGHLAPYQSSIELVIEGGLPLGLSAEAEYTESAFHLDPGEELTLVTDGIAEARSKSGELFGFERAASISILSAQHIAATAAAFGQKDDITVLKIRRQPVLVGAPR